jgi:peptidoglycan-associated lipoprotein
MMGADDRTAPRAGRGTTLTRLSNAGVLAVVALLPTLAGCAQQVQTAAPAAAARNEPLATPPPPQQPTVQTQGPAGQDMKEFLDEPALKDVFFGPDRADIVGDGAVVMMANARWLLARWLIDNMDYLVLIEGHTDDKGTLEDNLAIADLRAKAAASFLRAMSVPATRLLTVTYGSTRPVCTDKSDACAAKNRRVHFRMKRQ